MVATNKISKDTRASLAHRAAALAEDAVNGVPGAAATARRIMRLLASDRRIVAG